MDDRLLKKMRDIKEEYGNAGLRKFREQNGIDEPIGTGSYVVDHSKVDWKTKSHFIKVYKLELDKLIKKEDVSLEVLGFLTLLEKYIGYEDNYLYNDNDEYLDQKDLIKITGLSRKKVSDLLTVLFNHKILYKFPHPDDKRKNVYYVNPNVIYRGSRIDIEAKKFILEHK